MVRTALQRTALLRPGMAATALLVVATEPRRLAAAVATAMRRTKAVHAYCPRPASVDGVTAGAAEGRATDWNCSLL
jgi:hypothetical protein